MTDETALNDDERDAFRRAIAIMTVLIDGVDNPQPAVELIQQIDDEDDGLDLALAGFVKLAGFLLYQQSSDPAEHVRLLQGFARWAETSS